MRVGTTALDVELSLRFHADGAPMGLHSVVVDGQEMPPELAKAFYVWLRDRAPFDRAVEVCWANSEAEDQQLQDPLRVA